MQRGLRRARSDWVASMSDSISDGANGAVVWDSVRKLRDGLDGKPRPPAAKMKKADGSLASTPEENAVVFAEHFKSLYTAASRRSTPRCSTRCRNGRS